jgi:hypothetical protein
MRLPKKDVAGWVSDRRYSGRQIIPLHEVIIDDAQMLWFEGFLKDRPADDGWKIFMFSHAPPNGSGLRPQEKSCCQRLLLAQPRRREKCRKFIELVREHPSRLGSVVIFHLELGLSRLHYLPTIPAEEGPYPNRGSCTFAPD